MPLLTSLLLLIVTARLLGQVMVRFNQPALVGEMLAGVVLGPAVLQLVEPSPALAGISELAVFLIVLSAGLEMNFRDVITVFRSPKGVSVALLGFVLPFLSGVGVGLFFQLDAMRTIFLGLCVSITALPVAVRILESFKLLNSEIARYSIATAIINDVLALLILGVVLDLPQTRSFPAVTVSILVIGGKLLLLAILVVGFNAALELLEKKGGVQMQLIPEKLISLFGNEALFGIVIAFVLLFGSISDALGFHFVIGAFFGALLVDKKFFLASRYTELEKTIASVTGGFLAPVFFAYLGIVFQVDEFRSFNFVAVVLIVSVFSKILSGLMAGRIVGLSHHESLGLGFILNGRGVMGLVVATIAFERGFIKGGMFSTMVLMSLVTTILSPILFRKFALPHLHRESNGQI